MPKLSDFLDAVEFLVSDSCSSYTDSMKGIFFGKLFADDRLLLSVFNNMLAWRKELAGSGVKLIGTQDDFLCSCCDYGVIIGTMDKIASDIRIALEYLKKILHEQKTTLFNDLNGAVFSVSDIQDIGVAYFEWRQLSSNSTKDFYEFPFMQDFLNKKRREISRAVTSEAAPSAKTFPDSVLSAAAVGDLRGLSNDEREKNIVRLMFPFLLKKTRPDPESHFQQEILSLCVKHKGILKDALFKLQESYAEENIIDYILLLRASIGEQTGEGVLFSNAKKLNDIFRERGRLGLFSGETKIVTDIRARIDLLENLLQKPEDIDRIIGIDSCGTLARNAAFLLAAEKNPPGYGGRKAVELVPCRTGSPDS